MVKVTEPPVEPAEPVLFTVTVRVAHEEFPVWHKLTVLLPTVVPVRFNSEPLKFKVTTLGLLMLEM